MTTGSKTKWWIAIAWVSLAGLMFNGCALKRYVNLDTGSDDLPEEVLVQVPMRNHYRPRIVVCDFQGPAYAQSTGATASRMLFAELLKRNLRANLYPADRMLPQTPEAIAAMMSVSKYDMLVMGKVNDYLDGMISSDSRVESEMVVYASTGSSLQTVGYARAIESAPPRPSSFFLSMRDKGAPAPPAEDLLQINSAKFARMIAQMVGK